MAIVTLPIVGRHKFEIELVRSKKGVIFDKDIPSIHAAFIIVHSPDEDNFYYHSLMWMVQIAEKTDFEEEWLHAKDSDELRDIILHSWRKGSWRWIETLKREHKSKET
jgi:mannitol/fructose-specific phosphotransferase system IIA component (Ntr-type)